MKGAIFFSSKYLQGRQIPEQLTLYDRMMLKIAGTFNKDPKAGKDVLEGFDYMDKSTIQPIVGMAKEFLESVVLA